MSDIEDQQERQEILAIEKREEILKKLMQETGCEIVQENGQRKIGGPPPSKCSLFSKHLLIFLILFFNPCHCTCCYCSYLLLAATD